jgi:hypothetical protein
MEFILIKGSDYLNNECDVIEKIDDDGTKWIVPTDPENVDYEEYLASLNEASTI